MNSQDILKIENIANLSNLFIIRWNITNLCNYNCDFCIQGNKEKHIQKAKGERVETREKILDNIIKFIETKLNGKYERLSIFLIGGEVTILKDFPEILKKLVNCNFEGNLKIHITTNLSTSDEVLKYMLDLFNQKYKYERVLEVSASYYKNYVTEEEFMRKVGILYEKKNLNKKIISKIFNKKKLVKIISKIFYKEDNKKKYLNKIISKIEPVHVNINYPLCVDKDYDEYLKFKEKYNNKARMINYLIIRDYKLSISEDLKNRLKAKNEKERIKVTFKDGSVFYVSHTSKICVKLDGEKYFNPNGYLCDSGINNISISTSGDISRCPTCSKETIIGNIIDEIPDIRSDKFVCKSKKCVCSFFGVIEKNK